MKNVKAFIMNIVLILISVLAFVFMSQSFYTVDIGDLRFGEVSGYKFTEIEAKNLTSEGMLVKVSVIFTIILLSLLMLVAIVNILSSFGIVKNKKVAKILYFVSIALTVLVVVFAICALAGIAAEVKEINKIGETCKVGWAVIANLVLAVVSVVAALLSKVSSKKK